MLRIDRQVHADRIEVRTSGAVAGPWVAELRRVLAAAEGAAAQVVLDLSSVGFVDAAGEELLRSAVARGARIGGRSGFVGALLGLDEPRPCLAPEAAATAADRQLVAAVLAGQEDAFLSLVARCHGVVAKAVRCFVSDERAMDEVVCEAWLEVLGVLRGWDGRRRLEALAACTAARCASARAMEEAGGEAGAGALPALPGACTSCPAFAGPLAGWNRERPESARALAVLREAIDALPRLERAIITLRDVAGCAAEEVCWALRLTPARQRGLLHRARRRVHAALDDYLRTAA